MTVVKICGVTDDAERDAAARGGADAIGFIVASPAAGHRNIDVETAATLIADTHAAISVVVTTATDPVRIEAIANATGCDAVQLHGTTTIEGLRAVASRVSVPVVVAIGPDLVLAERLASIADGIVVDSVTTDGAGGTGRTHDWARTAAIVDVVDCPVVLAGGLSPSNVRDAIDTVAPAGVDAATGVEDEAGRTDQDSVERFIAAVNRTEVSVT